MSKDNFFVESENSVYNLGKDYEEDLFEKNLDFSIFMLNYPVRNIYTQRKILPKFN